MNTNQQTVHQMGFGINEMVKQATGRESVSSIEMDWVSVEQLARYIYGSGTGDLVSFDTNIPDAIESLIAYITAVQDLHGYDNPWPGGGGKNKSVINTATLVKGTTDSVTAEFDTPLPAGSYIITREFSGTATVARYVLLDENNTDIANTNIATNETATLTISSPAYSISIYLGLSQSAGATADITKIMLRDSSISDDTYAPYENICPITGWTGCDVVRTGKNLFDGTVTSQKYINSNGEEVNNASWSITDYIPVHAGGKIAYSGLTNVGTAPYSAFYGIDGKLISTFKQETGNNKTVNVPAAAKYVRFSISNSAAQINAFIVTTGTSAGDFDEYQGEIYAFTFPDEAGTVYGGTLDVLTGVLTVNRASIDLSSLSWSYVSTNNYFRAALTQGKGQEQNNILCSIFKYAGVCGTNSVMATAENATIWKRFDSGLSSNATHIYVKWTDYTDATQFKTAVTGQTIVYELATPLTFQLTAQEVTALIGENNIFADTGNVSVQYKVKEDLV